MEVLPIVLTVAGLLLSAFSLGRLSIQWSCNKQISKISEECKTLFAEKNKEKHRADELERLLKDGNY